MKGVVELGYTKGTSFEYFSGVPPSKVPTDYRNFKNYKEMKTPDGSYKG